MTAQRTLVAALLALPVGATAYLEIVYLIFGLTAKNVHPVVNAVTVAATFGTAFLLPLRGAARPAEVVLRSCRLGILTAALLPVFAIAVLMLWERAANRPDLGMGGLMLYSAPFVAAVAALVLAGLYWIGIVLSRRRLRIQL